MCRHCLHPECRSAEVCGGADLLRDRTWIQAQPKAEFVLECDRCRKGDSRDYVFEAGVTLCFRCNAKEKVRAGEVFEI